MTLTSDAPVSLTKALPTTITFAVHGSQLSEILCGVIPFSGRDDTLPVLTGVLWSFRPNAWHRSAGDVQLVLAATDRYTLGSDRMKVEQILDNAAPEHDKPVEALISWRECDQLAKRLRTVKQEVLVSLTFGEHGDVKQMTVNDYSISSTHQVIEGQFPTWERLLPSGESQSISGEVQYNPDFMAKFAKVKSGGRHCPMRLSWYGNEAERKPMQVKVGDTFVGLIMPIRTN